MAFEMRMSAGLHQEQRLELTQAARLEQRAALKLEMRQRLSAGLVDIGGEIGTDVPAVLTSAYDRAIGVLPGGDELKESLRMPEMKNSFIKSLLIDRASIIARKPIDALRWAEAMFNGVYRFDREDSDERSTSEVQAVDLELAFRNPDKARQDIEDLKGFLAQGAGSEGTMQRIREIHEALRVAEAIGPMVEQLTPVRTALLRAISEGRPIMYDALVDSAVFDRLHQSGEVSDRLINNIVAKISGTLTVGYVRKYNQNRQEVEVIEDANRNFIKTAITNTVGQMTLVAMGIIDAELFTVVRAEQPTFSKATADVLKKDYKLDVDKLLARYNLAKQGQAFFFSRYKTKTIAPSAEVDNEIRDFITKSVRDDQSAILEAMGFERKFDTLMFDMHDLLVTRGTSGSVDKESRILEFLQDMLADNDFLDFLKERIREKYIKDVRHLIEV